MVDLAAHLDAAAEEGFELDTDDETLLLRGLPTDLRIRQNQLCLRVCEREILGTGRQPMVHPGELACPAIFDAHGPRLELVLPATLWQLGSPSYLQLLQWLQRYAFTQDWNRTLLLQVREATDHRLLEVWTDAWWRASLGDVASSSAVLRAFRDTLPKPRQH